MMKTQIKSMHLLFQQKSFYQNLEVYFETRSDQKIF